MLNFRQFHFFYFFENLINWENIKHSLLLMKSTIKLINPVKIVNRILPLQNQTQRKDRMSVQSQTPLKKKNDFIYDDHMLNSQQSEDLATRSEKDISQNKQCSSSNNEFQLKRKSNSYSVKEYCSKNQQNSSIISKPQIKAKFSIDVSDQYYRKGDKFGEEVATKKKAYEQYLFSGEQSFKEKKKVLERPKFCSTKNIGTYQFITIPKTNTQVDLVANKKPVTTQINYKMQKNSNFIKAHHDNSKTTRNVQSYPFFTQKSNKEQSKQIYQNVEPIKNINDNITVRQNQGQQKARQLKHEYELKIKFKQQQLQMKNQLNRQKQSELQKTIDQLKKDIQNKNETMADKENQIILLRDQMLKIQTLQSIKYNQLQRQANSAKLIITKQQSDNKLLSQDLQQARIHIKQLQNCDVQHIRQKQQAEKCILELKDMNSLIQQSYVLEKQKNRIQSQQIRKQIQAKDKQISQLQNILCEKQLDNSKIRQKLKAIQQSIENEQINKQSEIQINKKTIEDLSEQMKQMQQTIFEYHSQQAKIYQNYSQILQIFGVQIDNNQNMHDKLMSTISSFTKNFSDLVNNVNKLQSDLNRSNTANQELTANKSKHRGQVRGYEKLTQKMCSRIQQLQTKIQQQCHHSIQQQILLDITIDQLMRQRVLLLNKQYVGDDNNNDDNYEQIQQLQQRLKPEQVGSTANQHHQHICMEQLDCKNQMEAEL